MQKLLQNELNLKLIELLCTGIGVEVSSTQHSKLVKKHRNTIMNKANKLFQYKIIDRPLCSFHWIFDVYPLLIIEKCLFNRDLVTETFIKNDPHIMKGFLFRENEYNTLLIQLHRDLYSYQKWKDDLKKNKRINSNKNGYLSEALLLSTKNLLKYDPSASILIIEQHFKNGRYKDINGLLIDEISLDLLKNLLAGKGIKINENLLADKLHVHRRTVQKRIQQLISEKIITNPLCRFPRIWIPPEYFQVLSLIEIKEKNEAIINALIKDPRVPVLLKTNERHFNLVVFSNFHNMEDHLSWQENYDLRFPRSFGEIKNSYLSPAMTFSIEQEHISKKYIQESIKNLIQSKLN
jgi:hypothetical protein